MRVAIILFWCLFAFAGAAQEAARAKPETITMHPFNLNSAFVLAEDPRYVLTTIESDFISEQDLIKSVTLQESEQVKLAIAVKKQDKGYCGTYHLIPSKGEKRILLTCAFKNPKKDGTYKKTALSIQGAASVTKEALSLFLRLSDFDKLNALTKDPKKVVAKGVSLRVPSTWTPTEDRGVFGLVHQASNTSVWFRPMQVSGDQMDNGFQERKRPVAYNLKPRGRLSMYTEGDSVVSTFWTCALQPCFMVVAASDDLNHAQNALYIMLSRLKIEGKELDIPETEQGLGTWTKGPENIIWLANRLEVTPRSDKAWERYLSNAAISGAVGRVGSSYTDDYGYNSGGAFNSQTKGSESFVLCKGGAGIWIRRAITESFISAGSFSTSSTKRDNGDVAGRWSVKNGKLIIRGRNKVHSWNLSAKTLGKIGINRNTWGIFRAPQCPPDIEEEKLENKR